MLSAVAIAIGGLGVAGPAQAAEPDHCVVALPEQNVKCFDTYEAAKAYVASVAEVNPPKSTGTAVQRVGAPAAAAALFAIPTLIYIGYDWDPTCEIRKTEVINDLPDPSTAREDLGYAQQRLSGDDGEQCNACQARH